MTSLSLYIVIGVTGGLDPAPATQAAWRTNLTRFFRSHRKRYRHAPHAILTPLRTVGEELAAEAAIEAGYAVFIVPDSSAPSPPQTARLNGPVEILPERLLQLSCKAGDGADVTERIAETICRFSHRLVTFDSDAADVCALADCTTKKWIGGDYNFGDEADDNDAHELLAAPPGDEIVRISSTPAKPRQPFPIYDGLSPLHVLDLANEELADADDPDVRRSANDILNEADRETLRASLAAAPDPQLGAQFLEHLDALRLLFARADRSAIRSKTTLGSFTLLFAASGPLAVLFYELGSAFEHTIAGAGVYLASIFISLACGVYLIWTRRQPRQNISRVAAEFCRVCFFWKMSGVDARVETTLERWMPGNHRGVQLLARSLDFAVARLLPAPVDLVPLVQRVWIGPSGPDPVAQPLEGHPGAQTVWHPKSARKLRLQAAKLLGWQTATFVLAVISASIIIAALASGHELAGALILLPLTISALPALAGAFSIYRERSSLPTLAENYERMARIANIASKRLDYLATHPDAVRTKRVIEQFGREALGESVDWLLAHLKQRVRPVMGA